MESKAGLSKERIEYVYESLAKMQVDLDPDPLELGPKRLNNKISEVRECLSKIDQIHLQLSHEHHALRREHRRLDLETSFLLQDLLANDPEVRAGRNVTDRDAIAKHKLRNQYEAINNILFTIEDLDTLLKVIRDKRNDLKDVQGRLRDQLKVCQEEISLGARWGSKYNPGTLDNVSNIPDMDFSHTLEALVAQVEAEVANAKADKAKAIEKPANEIDSFLSAISTIPTTAINGKAMLEEDSEIIF